jgi:hypothetical protein
MRVSETKVQSDLDKYFSKIELKSSLFAGASTTIRVEVLLGRALTMFIAEISQKEKQLVSCIGNLYIFYLPYATTTQTATVQLASSTLDSYTKTKPVSLFDSTITYGPYNNIAPFNVEETIDVVHNGAAHKGVSQGRRHSSVRICFWF